ncbi:hypothetical protein [Variovorax ginsengisoli]|uniref:Phasin domain-containing protein n=1 Tax=Variovorax ginsengisoli TaxID=363844 RepID=A0ABT8SG11_9BURK|nr:hypothetical protein [Variovorax ginsengisoli]MDN8618698.1 hypothetical protein [Variovorax ginsengisoli]MDO1537868.1 hypothetical protein [Variovorax ginsengisoli]
MNDMTQPFTNLASANAALVTNFAQSPAMFEMANANVQKYFELVQQSFGRVVVSDVYPDLIRKLTENYSTFAREYSESLMGWSTEGQSLWAQQAQAASDLLAESGNTTTAMDRMSDTVKHLRAR